MPNAYGKVYMYDVTEPIYVQINVNNKSKMDTIYTF